MEISPFWLYVILQLDEVTAGAAILFGASLAAIFCTGIFWAVCDDGWKTSERMKVFVKRSCISAVIACIVCVVVPNTKKAAAILVIPAVAKSDSLQNLGSTGQKLLELVNVWADEQIAAKAKKN